MSEQLQTLLERNPIFSQLNRNHLQQIASSALSRQYEAGSFVTYYGDVWPYLLIIKSGQLDMVKESLEGKQLIALSLKPGEAFWGLAFINKGEETPVAVAASAASEVYMWSREELVPILMDSPQAMWSLCQQMSTRMIQASMIVENLAFKPMSKRLATFLLDMFTDAGETSLKRYMTLADIAARVGSTREEVCRALYQLSDKNLIDITRTEFSLIDPDGLAAMADQTPPPRRV